MQPNDKAKINKAITQLFRQSQQLQTGFFEKKETLPGRIMNELFANLKIALRDFERNDDFKTFQTAVTALCDKAMQTENGILATQRGFKGLLNDFIKKLNRVIEKVNASLTDGAKDEGLHADKVKRYRLIRLYETTSVQKIKALKALMASSDDPKTPGAEPDTKIHR